MTSIGAGLGWSSSSATTAKNPSHPTRVCRTTQLFMREKPPVNYVARWRRPEAIWPDTWRPTTAAWTTIPVLSNHVLRIFLHDFEAPPYLPLLQVTGIMTLLELPFTAEVLMRSKGSSSVLSATRGLRVPRAYPTTKLCMMARLPAIFVERSSRPEANSIGIWK